MMREVWQGDTVATRDDAPCETAKRESRCRRRRQFGRRRCRGRRRLGRDVGRLMDRRGRDKGGEYGTRRFRLAFSEGVVHATPGSTGEDLTQEALIERTIRVAECVTDDLDADERPSHLLV